MYISDGQVANSSWDFSALFAQRFSHFGLLQERNDCITVSVNGIIYNVELR